MRYEGSKIFSAIFHCITVQVIAEEFAETLEADLFEDIELLDAWIVEKLSQSAFIRDDSDEMFVYLSWYDKHCIGLFEPEKPHKPICMVVDFSLQWAVRESLAADDDTLKNDKR